MSYTGTTIRLMVLVVAFLTGSVMAQTEASCTASGCLLPADYVLDGSLLTDPVNLGLLPANNFDGGQLRVMATLPYQITARDTNGNGKMSGDYSTQLTDSFKINGFSLGSDAVKIVDDGAATTDCQYDIYYILYTQTINGDTPGMYYITLRYNLGADT